MIKIIILLNHLLQNYDMLCCEKIKRIDIKDMVRLKSIYGFRRELLIYHNSFIFIHNNKVRVFSLDDL